MTTPDNAADPAADPTVKTPGQPGGQPDYKALWEQSNREVARLTGEVEQYKNRFTGLQGKYQQEQSRWQETANKATEFERQLQALIGEKEALQLSLNSLNTDKATLEDALKQAKNRIARFELLATEFPDLMPFEAKGLLPDAPTTDELKAKMTDFAAQLKALGAGAIANFNKGATPNPPSEPPANTSDALFRQAIKAQREGKLDEYDQLYSQAIALRKQGK